MRFLRTWLLIAVALFAVATLASAQTTNGTISGHVADSQGLALPGVTVNAASPNLQGVRTVVTSENGDYVLSLLPSGTYTLTFELSGFQTVTKTATLAPTQTLPIDASMGPAAVSETVNVVGRAADVLTQTSQVATNFKQDLISELPTNRGLDAVLLLAPNVHPTGPTTSGGIAYSIAGAPSFESLYMINGVTVNENIRGQANALYIEDAVQETTVASAGISAEYGRFSGGVINVITKSGGNTFSGSFRDTLNNDNWRGYTLMPAGAAVPGNRTATVPSSVAACGLLANEACGDGARYPRDTRSNVVIPTYEYTVGGPILKDHLWFFTAGRLTSQDSTRQLFITNIPYTFTDNQKRYEGKLTYSVNSNHRFQGAFTKILRDQINANQFNVMDTSSLYTAKLPQDLTALNYNGVLSSTFFLEARGTIRHSTSHGIGAPTQDLINGTLVRDLINGTRYWVSTFCGVCRDEQRDNNDLYLKGNYFLSRKGSGSHNIVFGYDTFDDIRVSDNYQSGSSYRVIGTTTIVRGTTIYPKWDTTGANRTVLEYDPIGLSSSGTAFRTHSLFVNDNLRWNNNVTFNLGLRFDKNHGVDAMGNLTVKDSAFSPRVGVVWDPKGNGDWAVTASFGRYVAAIANSIADSSSQAGAPSAFQWAYNGPAINQDVNAASLIDTPTAIQTVFNQCKRDANGLCTNMGPIIASSVPGVGIRIPDGLISPNVLEYAFGVSRQVSNRAAVRADYVFRNYRDFYSRRIDQTTGRAVDSLGNPTDIAITENTNDLKRRYQGVTVSGTYRMSGRTDIGANYTLSRLWGNFDGENITSGPIPATNFQYPEFRQQSWYAPEGDLSADQRHRARIYLNYGVPKVPALTVSILQNLSSGVPYGAVGTVDARPYVPASVLAAYVTPQGATSETYYYTARDAFRTDSEFRTDLSATVNHSLNAGSHKVDLFIQMQVLNLFDQFQLCGCGASVFNNGGNVDSGTINTGVNSPNGTTRPNFNPFTQAPVQGVNWDFAPGFGTASSRFAFTSPRTFRMTFGVRF
ncbi:MAG TPA: TonB-dependent receptor [Vicinamibacterales bacterium]|nr:TonB-dependent receptor [Vicinamibacterales bacterium]